MLITESMIPLIISMVFPTCHPTLPNKLIKAGISNLIVNKVNVITR